MTNTRSRFFCRKAANSEHTKLNPHFSSLFLLREPIAGKLRVCSFLSTSMCLTRIFHQAFYCEGQDAVGYEAICIITGDDILKYVEVGKGTDVS